MNSLDTVGGLLSVYIRLGSLYSEMSSCSFPDREKVDLDENLDRKGYLLNKLQISRYSLPLWLK